VWKISRFTIFGSKAVEEQGKVSQECIYRRMRVSTTHWGGINISFHAIKKPWWEFIVTAKLVRTLCSISFQK
jgi:hypothetical protein